ncbi:hypothetical protein [Wolbachia pipientis]|nr:hypothetical protein [Wolbachia pipientis]
MSRAGMTGGGGAGITGGVAGKGSAGMTPVALSFQRVTLESRKVCL